MSTLFFKVTIEHKACKTIFDIQYTLSDCVIRMLVRSTSVSKVKCLVRISHT